MVFRNVLKLWPSNNLISWLVTGTRWAPVSSFSYANCSLALHLAMPASQNELGTMGDCALHNCGWNVYLRAVPNELSSNRELAHCVGFVRRRGKHNPDEFKDKYFFAFLNVKKCNIPFLYWIDFILNDHWIKMMLYINKQVCSVQRTEIFKTGWPTLTMTLTNCLYWCS